MTTSEETLASRSDCRFHNTRNSISSLSIFNMTPPLSSPENSTPPSRQRAPPAGAQDLLIANQPIPLRMPIPAQLSQTLNPYATAFSGQFNPETSSPPEYNNRSFEISSDPTSPSSPSFPSAPYARVGNPGEESLFDRWLRHEDLARPIFPGSRTGSSVATSDISSVREGMFGSLPSLPGGQATGESRRSRRGSRSAPGSVTSRGTRDRENFSSSSVPSYPSSRSGGSRPNSRWGAEENTSNLDGEIFPTSIPASPTMPYSDTASRLSYSIPAPPPAPTPPTSTSPDASTTSLGGGDSGSRVNLPDVPQTAFVRPPRYSDTFAGAIRLEELINRDIAIGGQGAIPIQLKSEQGEKGEKGNSQGTKTVMLVQEDVWIEMSRLAGLARQNGYGNASGAGSDLELGLPRQSQTRGARKRARRALCCGGCVIS